MNEKCKIVQDLLPNYIEKLTSSETNKFIEEHIKECNECSNILKNMKKEISVDSKKQEDREVKYIEKYSKKMKWLKSIIIVVILIVITIIAGKMIILGGLKSKLNDRLNANNYYVKSYDYMGTQFNSTETFYKDGKFLYKLTSVSGDNLENSKMVEYYDGKTSKFSMTGKDGIEHISDENMENSYAKDLIKIQNWLYTENVWDFIKMAMDSSITTESCNGKECYRIKTNGRILYEDKETGLPVRITLGATIETNGNETDTISDFYYEFDSVKDEDIKF